MNNAEQQNSAASQFWHIVETLGKGGNIDCYLALEKLMAEQLQSAYERGQMKGDATGDFKGYMEGLKNGKKVGRQQALQEIMEVIPGERFGSFNECRATILSALETLKTNTREG
jgi:flagellar biosynthesis/type III secretory pathway protein FliH